MGWAEAYRSAGRAPRSFGGDLGNLHTGDAVGPLGLADDPDTFAELKVKDFKSGRVAMFSMFGCSADSTPTANTPAVRQRSDSLHPGDAFNPLAVADAPDSFAELKVNEIKNGWLAMFSMFASYVQVIVTGEGPAGNWSSHIADPFAVNSFALSNMDQRALEHVGCP